MVPTEVTW